MTIDYPIEQIHLVGYDYFVEWCKEQYDFDIDNCGKTDVLYALLCGQNYVLKTSDYENNKCSCNSSYDLEEYMLSIVSAICIYAYDYLEMNYINDDASKNSPNSSVESNCFMYLYNKGMIVFHG